MRIRSSNVLGTSDDGRKSKGYPRFTSQSSSEYETDSKGKYPEPMPTTQNRRIARAKTRPDSHREQKAPVTNISDERREEVPIAALPTPFPPTLATESLISPDPLPRSPETYQPSVSLPEGWESHLDEVTGYSYYFQPTTGTVQWEFPDLGSAPEPIQTLSPPRLSPPSHRARHQNSGQNFQEILPPVSQKGKPAFVTDEDHVTVAKVKDDSASRSKKPDSKKSRGSIAHMFKQSGKGSANSNASDTSSDSKRKPKDSSSKPLSAVLTGGKKR